MPRSARQLLARTPGTLVTYPAALGGQSSGALCCGVAALQKLGRKRIAASAGPQLTLRRPSIAMGVSIRSRIDGAHEGLHLIDGRRIL
jgi:hypothetical protein